MNYLTLAACAVVVALLLMMSFNASAVAGEASFQVRSRGRNYSKFSHRPHLDKEKLACDSCHKFPTATGRTYAQRNASVWRR